MMRALLTATAIALASPVSAAPVAYVIFCHSNKDECVKSGTSVAPAKTITLLKRVNDRVNGRITYTPEKIDKWTLEPWRGDCEDYAATKYARLRAKGVPTNAMSYAWVTSAYKWDVKRKAFVPTENGESHAVLIVNTTAGRYVLDNIEKRVVPYADMKHKLREFF